MFPVIVLGLSVSYVFSLGLEEASKQSSANTLAALQRSGVKVKGSLHALEPAVKQHVEAVRGLEIAYSDLKHRNEVARQYKVASATVNAKRIEVASASEEQFNNFRAAARERYQELDVGVECFNEGLMFDETDPPHLIDSRGARGRQSNFTTAS